MNKAHESPNTNGSRFSPSWPRRDGRWLCALAATCLAVALTAGMVLAGSATAAVSGRPLAPAASGPCPPQPVKGPDFALNAVAGDGQVQLSWSESDHPEIPPPITVRYCAQTGDSGVTASSLVKNLPNGTTYYFWLVANNKIAVSNTASATPAAPPGQPTGLTATPGDSKVSLSWSGPTPDGGAPITGYEVREGTSSGGEGDVPTSSSPVTGTGTTVTGLVNGTTYFFTVTAVNRVGQGQVSAEVSAIPVAVPGAPLKLTAIAGDGQITLSWTAPASSGGLPVTGYHLYVGTTADFSKKSPLIPLTGTAVTVTDLVNGTTYYFRVTAVNRAGEGPAAEAEAVPVTTPGVPTKLTATPGNSQVRLSWSAPASDGGAQITDYIVSEGTSPGGETGDRVSGSPVSGTSTTVTGLHSGTTYYFTVAARNTEGLSSQSVEASAALPPIVITSTAPSRATTPSRTVTPSDAASPTSAASPSNATDQSSGPTQSSIDGESTSHASASARTPPTGLTATAGNALVHLSWSPPQPGGGPPVSGYKVYFAKDPGMRASTLLASTAGTGGNAANLVNGTVYYFVVTAVNAAGEESPASTEVSAEPNGPDRGVTVSLDSASVPKQLTGLLAAAAALVAAGVFTLVTRHRRRLRRGGRQGSAPGQKHPGQQLAAPSDVRAVPRVARPATVSVRETGQQPTQTVRLERHPGVATTTIREKP